MSRYYYSIYGPYIEQYLDVQRNLGYKPKERNSMLVAFDRLALERDEAAVGISKELADRWGSKALNESEVNRYKRIQSVRLFSLFLCKTGHPSYIAQLPKFKSTFTPYIFTKEQVLTFFNVCDHMETWIPNRPTIFVVPVLFRLLYATGLRVSEALALTCPDVNLKDNYLIVRNSKNGVDRMVPISESLAEICNGYFQYRNHYAKHNLKGTDYFFMHPDGKGCSVSTVYNWFRRILQRAGISHGGRDTGPRLHDFRHTFACHSVVQMTEMGLDLYYSLPILSTYLGHRSLSATDGYIRLTEQMYPGIVSMTNRLAPDLFPDITNLNGHETN